MPYFGTGKPQAALLIELKDPSNKTADLIDSIWQTIQTANAMSRHKNQLLRDFVTFAQPDMPFLRTDKGTVKRSATLALYSDYIERFYSSRSDEIDSAISLDLSSISSIEDSIRTIVGPLLSEPQDTPPNADLFVFGLDSLGVFAAVKALRVASGLGDKIAPRHVYANPTIASLATTVSNLMDEAQSVKDDIPLDQNPG
jgi:Phosphopantetheine attachment site.